MKPHVVRQGEYLTKISHTLGFDAERVWNDPKNEALRKKRVDFDQLQPGDILFVPDAPRPRLALEVGGNNQYVARIPKMPVVLKLQVGGEILVKEPYRILGLGPDPIEGATDEKGYLSAKVDVHIREIKIELIDRKRTLRVRVGNLDPINEISGLQKRLTHLGFYQPSFAGTENFEAKDVKQLTAALATFQSSVDLPATGRLDEETAKALVDAHGS